MTVITSVVLLPHVYTLVVSREIRLANEFPVAVAHCTRERILPILIMRLKVGLVVVTPAKQFSTPLDLALVVGVFLGGEFASLWPRPPVHSVVGQRILVMWMRLGGRDGWVHAAL